MRMFSTATERVRFGLLALGLLAASTAFAGVTQVGPVPGGAAAQSMYPCVQNCQPGDEKCVQTCAKLAPQQQAAPANFQCLNQCTRAGYAYGYCKTLCSN